MDAHAQSFFLEVYELYVKIMLNPFHGTQSTIANKQFDVRVKALARRLLG